jgi:hypothetical protein
MPQKVYSLDLTYPYHTYSFFIFNIIASNLVKAYCEIDSVLVIYLAPDFSMDLFSVSQLKIFMRNTENSLELKSVIRN